MEDLFTKCIYASMLLLVVFSLIDFRGNGILPLLRISRQFRRACKRLKDPVFSEQLRNDILADSAATSEEMFTSKSMRHQMSLFRSDCRKMGITADDKHQCDIEDYFNTEYLDYCGNNVFCDHCASGLTALGILGTFVGMTTGLTGFDITNSDTIISGISNLLLGMSTAFETSIAGITLSLIVGTIFRSIRGNADKGLDRFLDLFRSNVLQDQSEAAANLLLTRLENLEKLFSDDSEARQEAMNTVVKEFVAHMGERLTDQVASMREAIEDTTKQQQVYITTIQGLCTQVEAATLKIAGISSAFEPVVEQARRLSEQIVSANTAVQSELKTISSIVTGDAAILSQQHDLSNQMNQYASSLSALSLRMAEQTSLATTAIANLSACSTSVINDSQTALETQLRSMMLSASDFNEAITQQSRSCIDMLHSHVEHTMRQLPRTSGSDELLEQLVEQNREMLENQQKLLAAISRRRKKVLNIGGRSTS